MFNETLPPWLQTINSSPMGAEAASLTKDPDLALSRLKNFAEVKKKINDAWRAGRIDDQYIKTVFRSADDLLLFALTAQDDQPLVLRPRTTEEIMMDFPLNPNPDNSRCIPIGQTVSLENSQPLWINPQQNTGPVLLIGPEARRAKFLQIMSASAKLTNRNLVKIWEEKNARDFLATYEDNEKFVNLMSAHKYNLAAIPAAMSESISPATNASPFFHFWITANSAGEIPKAYQQFLREAIIFSQDASGPGTKQFAKNGQIFWELTPTGL